MSIQQQQTPISRVFDALGRFVPHNLDRDTIDNARTEWLALWHHDQTQMQKVKYLADEVTAQKFRVEMVQEGLRALLLELRGVDMKPHLMERCHKLVQEETLGDVR